MDGHNNLYHGLSEYAILIDRGCISKSDNVHLGKASPLNCLIHASASSIIFLILDTSSSIISYVNEGRVDW